MLFLLRLGLGVMFFYAGLSKLLNPTWSAAGYLNNAQTLSGLYKWFASPSVLPVINVINEWGLLLLGISLILGLFVRLSTVFGSVLMLLYYIPILHFPYVGKTAFLIDDHVIFILALLTLNAFRAGRVYGLEMRCSNLSICKKYQKIRNLLG